MHVKSVLACACPRSVQADALSMLSSKDCCACMHSNMLLVWVAQMDLRVTGPGVTPFGPANQQRLINVFADASRNISQSAFRVILVADAYTSRRRRLLVRRKMTHTSIRMREHAHSSCIKRW